MSANGSDSGQDIMEEEIDADYEPTSEEVLEYATWLGMDLATEQELLWIAHDGLTAKLPPEWKPCKTPGGELYYFNFATGESAWEHPCDTMFKELYQSERAKLERHGASNSSDRRAAPSDVGLASPVSLKDHADGLTDRVTASTTASRLSVGDAAPPLRAVSPLLPPRRGGSQPRASDGNDQAAVPFHNGASESQAAPVDTEPPQARAALAADMRAELRREIAQQLEGERAGIRAELEAALRHEIERQVDQQHRSRWEAEAERSVRRDVAERVDALAVDWQRDLEARAREDVAARVDGLRRAWEEEATAAARLQVRSEIEALRAELRSAAEAAARADVDGEIKSLRAQLRGAAEAAARADVQAEMQGLEAELRGAAEAAARSNAQAELKALNSGLRSAAEASVRAEVEEEMRALKAELRSVAEAAVRAEVEALRPRIAAEAEAAMKRSVAEDAERLRGRLEEDAQRAVRDDVAREVEARRGGWQREAEAAAWREIDEAIRGEVQRRRETLAAGSRGGARFGAAETSSGGGRGAFAECGSDVDGAESRAKRPSGSAGPAAADAPGVARDGAETSSGLSPQTSGSPRALPTPAAQSHVAKSEELSVDRQGLVVEASQHRAAGRRGRREDGQEEHASSVHSGGERRRAACKLSAHAPAWQLLAQADAFVRSQKALLRGRQVAMLGAREEWLRSAEALEGVATGEQRAHLREVLRKVHDVLEAQAQRLNADALQLAVMKDHLRQLRRDPAVTDAAGLPLAAALYGLGGEAAAAHVLGPSTACLPNHLHSGLHVFQHAWPPPAAAPAADRQRFNDFVAPAPPDIAAEDSLETHARWLRSFREQITRATSKPASAAVSRGSSSQHASARPVHLDLGDNRELVISVHSR